jgi:hypothetical protein
MIPYLGQPIVYPFNQAAALIGAIYGSNKGGRQPTVLLT